jgi:hypothetical protein
MTIPPHAPLTGLPWVSGQVRAAGGAQKVKRTLRQMWASGYILRPTEQTRTVAITGPQPMVYGISNKGARLLREHGHLMNLDCDFSETSRPAGITFIDHGVAQPRFMTALEIAQRNRSDITLVDAAAIIACARKKPVAPSIR